MPNINSAKEWSEMDLWDLENYLAPGASVTEMADFLCRDEHDVRDKMVELELKESLGAMWTTRTDPHD